MYACKEGVTAIDFSKAYPNLLAVSFVAHSLQWPTAMVLQSYNLDSVPCWQVGMYDGGVAIYNVASMKDEPIIDNL